MKPRVAMLIPATNKYTSFANSMVESIKQHFLTDCDVVPFVLTNRPDEVRGATLPIAHAAWPGVTIRKFHYIVEFADKLKEFDYIFMSDADMRVVAPVGRDILSELTVAQHAFYVDKPLAELPYDRNPRCKAFVRPDEGKVYVAGGFFGGAFREVVAAAEVMAARIDDDKKNNVVAVWHDESHLNRYVIDHPPSVVLPPSYVFPEGTAFPYEPKILALNKDHSVIRSSGIGTWMVRGRRLVRRGGLALLNRVGVRRG